MVSSVDDAASGNIFSLTNAALKYLNVRVSRTAIIIGGDIIRNKLYVYWRVYSVHSFEDYLPVIVVPTCVTRILCLQLWPVKKNLGVSCRN